MNKPVTYQLYPRDQLRACAAVLNDAAQALRIFTAGDMSTGFAHYAELTKAEALLARPEVIWPIVLKPWSPIDFYVRDILCAARKVLPHLLEVDRARAEALKGYIDVPQQKFQMVSSHFVLRDELVVNRSTLNLKEPSYKHPVTGVNTFFDYDLLSEECRLRFQMLVMTVALMKDKMYRRSYISPEESQALSEGEALPEQPPPPYEERAGSAGVARGRCRARGGISQAGDL